MNDVKTQKKSVKADCNSDKLKQLAFRNNFYVIKIIILTRIISELLFNVNIMKEQKNFYKFSFFYTVFYKINKNNDLWVYWIGSDASHDDLK